MGKGSRTGQAGALSRKISFISVCFLHSPPLFFCVVFVAKRKGENPT
jgi:hypothetical protein